jgi:hypothetical protein
MSFAGSATVHLHRPCEEPWLRARVPAGRQISDHGEDRRDADVETTAARIWVREIEVVQ